MILTAEYGEQVAIELMETSNMIGVAINSIEQLAKANSAAIRQEKAAYETAVLGGKEVRRALRVLAMRLDRSVLAKISE